MLLKVSHQLELFRTFYVPVLYYVVVEFGILQTFVRKKVSPLNLMMDHDDLMWYAVVGR